MLLIILSHKEEVAPNCWDRPVPYDLLVAVDTTSFLGGTKVTGFSVKVISWEAVDPLPSPWGGASCAEGAREYIYEPFYYTKGKVDKNCLFDASWRYLSD